LLTFVEQISSEIAWNIRTLQALPLISRDNKNPALDQE
jgi:hypothetical protein